ncbi:amino acid adenylation domain-containing protein [Tenacibaculum sp. TC6]|uniref:amino acid adenylation domain-containing protein n=1 Tax=Tenacibaculum sp. TC6 TaxID=3423223 RepID=UPI003D361DEB
MKESTLFGISKTSYWKEKIETVTKTVPYTCYSEENIILSKKESFTIQASEMLSEKIITISKEKDVNIFKLFMTGLSIVLSKYTVYEDLLITTSTLNINSLNEFIKPNLSFFKINLNDNDSVKDLLGKIHSELIEVVENQDYDFEELTKEVLSIKENKSTISGIGFFYEELNTWIDELSDCSCLLKLYKKEDKLSIKIEYSKELYSKDEMELFCLHLLKAIEVLLDDLNVKAKKINFITEKDKQIIFDELKRAEVVYEQIPVVTQFEQQVLKTPELIAVKSGNITLSYEELNERANKLAHFLLENCNLKKHQRVALMVDRSEKVMIGALAVLKAGGVFIPIDLSAPKERVDYCLYDCECSVILTEDWYIEEQKNKLDKVFVSMNDIHSNKTYNPQNQLEPTDVIYMIYTSGTTGKPKGSMIYNYSLTNNVNWFKRQYELTEKDSTMLINSYNFDGCYGYVWATLVTGGILHIPNETIFDPDATLEYIKKEKVTHIKIVPSTFGILVNSQTFISDTESCKSLRIVKQGGEAINVNNLEKYFKQYPEVTLGNHYGPTECTIGSVAYWITKDTFKEFKRRPVLGKLYDNQEIYIMDASLTMQPVGVLGEVCIGGEGVSKGYYNQPELTETKFVDHPLKPGKKIYRTGDQARWLPNGTLEFVGRLDNQVKIRGYRVELDEITEVAKEYPLITDAITLVYKNEEEEFLTLWFVSKEGISKEEITNFLKQKLPSYMIPHYYVREERMPITPNGKVNKKALSDPKKTKIEDEKAIILPRNNDEEKMLNIWKDILNVEEISIFDNFFEIGGHSLKASQLAARIRQAFGVRLPLREIFVTPILSDLTTLIISQEANDQYVSIDKAPLQNDYALSHSQERMWILNQIEENKATYNVPHAVRLVGDVNKDILNQSIQALIDKHEVLRTIFVTVNGAPRQKILDSYLFTIQYEDLRNENNADDKLRQISERQVNYIFQLDKKPPLSSVLVRVSEQEYIFFFTLHHIVSDGWSTQVFTQELLFNYEAIRNNKEAHTEPLKIQYKDFAFWQNNLLEDDKDRSLKAYWSQKFSGEITSLELPYDKPLKKDRSHKGATKKIFIEEGTYNKVKDYANINKASSFMVLLSLVKTLLYRYTGQNDIIVGTPIAGREHVDLEEQIGFYVNTLAIRSEIKGTFSFNNVLEEVKNNLLEAYQHQLYPFDKLIQDLNITASTSSRNPLFDVFAVMQNKSETIETNIESLGFELVSYEQDFEHSKFDLLFNFIEENNGLSVEIDYSIDLFFDSKIDRMLAHFNELLITCLEMPETKVGEVYYLTKNERIILHEFNGSVSEEMPWRSLVDEFNKQVKKSPFSLALADDTLSYTYQELDEKTNKIANYLLSKYTIKKDEIIAVLCDRTADYICSILAIIKAGGAYLPLERTFTEEHIQNLLSISETKVMITDKLEDVEKWENKLNCLDITDSNSILTYNGEKVEKSFNSLEALAYVMFTSGTTGTPKGVMVNHKNILRLVKNISYSNISEKDKLLQTGSLSFDAATFEIWGALLNGGELHIIKKQNLLDVKSLYKTKKDRGITKMWITTAWFHQLADIDTDIFQGLDEIWVGGERLSPIHFKKVKEVYPNVPIINFYGPTENTTFSTSCEVFHDDIENIPIGYPIDNTTVYILDNDMQPVPIGITGEIYLGGLGVSKGYLNNEEETRKRFITLPFSGNEYLYKSGDLGRWQDDGRITFFGRKDHQVKIRGHRIELDGVVSLLQKHPLTLEVEVLALNLQGSDKTLVGYYTSENDVNLENELRDYLRKELPSYMVPTYLVHLEQMPLNKNGKIDRKLLPLPNAQISESEEYIEPSTETEKQLISIIREILNLTEKISVKANFFELGGHSLKAILLANKIEENLNASVSYNTIFSVGTIEELASIIDEEGNITKVNKIQPAPKQELYLASSAQKRFYTIYKYDEESLAYNVTGSIQLSKKEYSLEKIQKACDELVKRHESLRTEFVNRDNELYQKIHENYNIVIESLRENDIEKSLQNFVKPFNLEKGPLFRVGYVKTKDNENWLLLDMHHSITDGLSQVILENELFALLEDQPLTTVPFQYKDYVYWLLQAQQQERFKLQKNYWVKRYEEEVPELHLPIDFERTIQQDFKGKTIQFKISSENAEFLIERSKTQTTTLYTIMLSVWSIVLSKLGGVEDLVIGTPVAGRMDKSWMNVVGVFINTIPLRLRPKGNHQFIDYLDEVKNNVINDLNNQEYPFQDILEAINYDISSTRNPLFDTMFSLLSSEEFKLSSEDFLIEDFLIEDKATGVKFDLNFKVADLGKEIVCSLDYRTGLFEDTTVIQIVERFNLLLDILRINPSIDLKEIDILLQEEKEKLLINVNETAVVYPEYEKTINQLFAEKVALYPEKRFLVDTFSSLTLLEVEYKANCLASYIVEKGFSNKVLGIYMEPSVEVIIAILAIFKSGSAYLPIDTDLPEDRILYTVKDSSVECIIASSNFMKQLPFEGDWINIDDEDSWSSCENSTVSLNTPESLAYIIYTSGSTGSPKGVRITQKQLVNYTTWFTNKLSYSYKDSAALLSSFAFDLGHSAVFPTIVNGGTLHMLKKEEYLNVEYLTTYLHQEKISFIKSTPTFFSLLINDQKFTIHSLKYLRWLMLGGEAINTNDLQKFFKYYPNKKIINHYGPTEGTIGCIVKPLDCHNYRELEKESIIGKPINNMKVYILDSYQKPVAQGVQGQIYISGIGVSEGYHKQKELTEEKFIESPFENGKKLYATGDLGYWSKNDEVVFKGRVDDQIKIRGYRVELGEVTRAIIAIPFVRNTSLLVKKKNDERQLIAFVEVDENKKVSEIREALETSLPSYMIPNSIILIDKIPVTPNGKVDRKELERLSLINNEEEGELPSTKLEKELAAIWEEILQVKVKDINASFFLLGGHSLKALNLINCIEHRWGKKVPLKMLYANATIKKLEVYLESLQEERYTGIVKSEEQVFYPLSYSQKRLWMLHEFSVNKLAYNVPKVYWLTGEVTVEALSQALTDIVKRHEVLRTVFKMVEGEPRQFIIPFKELKNLVKIESLPVEENKVDGFVSKLINKNFDLAEGPLFDFRIFTTKNKKTLLSLNFHHIISDGWSATILLNELCERYNALIKGEEIYLPKLEIQYKDYAVWQNEQFKRGIFEKDKLFWKKKLSGEFNKFSLPLTYPKSGTKTIGKSINYIIDNSLIEKIENLANRNDVSLYMMLLASFKTLAYRYTNQNDILIGTVVAGREKQELANQVGFYVNTIAQRTILNVNRPFKELLETIKEDLLETVEYQYYPFDQVVNDLGISGSEGESPLFDIMFIHQNTEEVDESSLLLSGLKIEGIGEGLSESKFDASFVTRRTKQGLQIFVEYNAAVYSESFLTQYLKHFERILEVVCIDPNQTINQIDYLGTDKELLLTTFNNTQKEKDYKTIHEMVEKQVERTPNKTAIIFNDKRITYQELDDKSNALAIWILENYQPKPNDIIAISLQRSEWQIISMLAILKSGAAFLPIDSKLPPKRKEIILEDANPLFVIGDDSLHIFDIDIRIESVEKIKKEVSRFRVDKPEGITIKSNDLAYVIYTSGSTGKPKGVMIEHRGNINMVTDQVNQLKICADDRCLQFASMSFDASVYEIFIALYAGSSIVLISEDTIANPLNFTNYITEHKVTFATLPPAYLSNLNKESLSTLRVLVTAGEAPNGKDARYFGKKINYFNAYGPTEYSVCATLYKVNGEENKIIPIGKPLENTQIYILNEKMNLMPIGCWGEMYISGHGIARGYINRPEQNTMAFINNPFKEGDKLYKTGDICRWLYDGNIEFKSRSGEMIKIRGYRVEKGEISSAILSFPDIKEAVISFKKEQQILSAYIVADKSITSKNLKEYLKGILPEYMIPTYIISLEKIPLTTNGKVDYKKLDTLIKKEQENHLKQKRKPENYVETQLLEIWSDILNLNKELIGTDDNFFEIGGQSILLMKLIGQLWNVYQKEISLQNFLGNATIKELSGIILGKTNEEKSLLVTLNKEGYDEKMFMIPPVLGTSIIYKALAEKLEKIGITCYGVQYRGFDYETNLDLSIPAMAKGMVKEIEPYLSTSKSNIVLGYSMGAILALEIVTELEIMGYETKLVLIDKDPGNAFIDILNNEKEFHEEELIQHVITEHMQGIPLPESSMSRIERLVQNNIQLLKEYEGFTKIINSDLLALEASESAKKNKMLSWETVTNKRFYHETISGNHFSILQEANLNNIIEAILKLTNKNFKQKL